MVCLRTRDISYAFTMPLQLPRRTAADHGPSSARYGNLNFQIYRFQLFCDPVNVAEACDLRVHGDVGVMYVFFCASLGLQALRHTSKASYVVLPVVLCPRAVGFGRSC